MPQSTITHTSGRGGPFQGHRERHKCFAQGPSFGGCSGNRHIDKKGGANVTALSKELLQLEGSSPRPPRPQGPPLSVCLNQPEAAPPQPGSGLVPRKQALEPLFQRTLPPGKQKASPITYRMQDARALAHTHTRTHISFFQGNIPKRKEVFLQVVNL